MISDLERTRREFAQAVSAIRSAQLRKALAERKVRCSANKIKGRLKYFAEPTKVVDGEIQIRERWFYRGNPLLDFKLDVTVGGKDDSRLRADQEPDHAGGYFLPRVKAQETQTQN